MNLEIFFETTPYSWDKQQKDSILLECLSNLTRFHYENCKEYRSLLNALKFNHTPKSLNEIPFLPVGLFKELELMSITKEDIFKILTSSGTSGQQTSKIFLSQEVAAYQRKTLVKVVSNFIGKERVSMVILDTASVLKDRAKFSARGAGVLGFSIFAKDTMYAFDDSMQLNLESLQAFLAKHKGERILFFGFTFIVWEHFYKALKNHSITLNVNAILIHGGGWKKLIDRAVSKEDFKADLGDVGINEVYDYYGMAEQVGSIYMECEKGYLHSSHFSKVIVRNPYDFAPCKIGEKGVVQVMSVIAKSYPGHSLLTQDLGVICGVDDCACGRKGEYFKVLGRLQSAEIRGCSDTYGNVNG